jgi:hypothetical protein
MAEVRGVQREGLAIRGLEKEHAQVVGASTGRKGV